MEKCVELKISIFYSVMRKQNIIYLWYMGIVLFPKHPALV